METTDRKTTVDESPIVVTGIVVDRHRYVAFEPLKFEGALAIDGMEPLFMLEDEFDRFIDCTLS